MAETTGRDYGLLVLRVVLGGIFVAHGVAILLPGGEGLDGFTAFVGSLGLPLPAPPLALAALAAEIGGGLLVALGLFARLGAAGIAGVMLVAIFFVHLSNGFFLVIQATPEAMAIWPGPPGGARAVPHGVEYCVALLAMSLCIVASGGGGISLLPAKHRKKKS